MRRCSARAVSEMALGSVWFVVRGSYHRRAAMSLLLAAHLLFLAQDAALLLLEALGDLLALAAALFLAWAGCDDRDLVGCLMVRMHPSPWAPMCTRLHDRCCPNHAWAPGVALQAGAKSRATRTATNSSAGKPRSSATSGIGLAALSRPWTPG